MTYSKNPKIDRYYEVVKKLEEAKPGQIVRVEGNPVELRRMRETLYSWMRNTGTKSLFKLTTPYPGLVQIVRGLTKPDLKVYVEGAPPEVRDFVLDNLLDVEDENLALTLVKRELPEKLWVETLDEWRRVVGTTAKETYNCKIQGGTSEGSQTNALEATED